jgi:putative drug exporter of the RND superfamily
VVLFGRWNWWLPNWAARLLRLEPSRPLPQRVGSAEPRTTEGESIDA